MADKATAITWIIGISIYYVGIIALFSFAIGIDEDISISDGGFMSIEQLRSQGGACGYPKTTEYQGLNLYNNYCSQTYLTNNETCSEIQGCYWSDERWFIPFTNGGSWFGDAYCKGRINTTFYNGGVTLDGERICEASQLDTNENLCTTLGCTWTDFSQMSNTQLNEYAKPTPMTFLKSVGFLSGFRADFGFDGVGYIFISFLLFYLPLLLLIGAIYMLIPLI